MKTDLQRAVAALEQLGRAAIPFRAAVDSTKRAVAALDQLGLAAVPFQASVDSAVEALAEIVPEVPPAGNGVSTMNRGPDSMGQLALYFLQCSREQLLGSFVGLISDAAFDADGVFVGSRESLGSVLLAVRAVLDPGRESSRAASEVVQSRAEEMPAAVSVVRTRAEEMPAATVARNFERSAKSMLPKRDGAAMHNFLRSAGEILRGVPETGEARLSSFEMSAVMRARVVEAIKEGVIGGFVLRYGEHNRCYIRRAVAAEPAIPEAPPATAAG